MHHICISVKALFQPVPGLSDNIGRVREVAVPGEASVGAAGALAVAVTKAISAKGRRPAAANTLLYVAAVLL